MTTYPRFSVLICNYNYAAFVADAIRSALDQDYPADRIEVVVVDDGSTDDPEPAYAHFAHEPRVRILRQENRGQTATFTAGVQASTGDYVCLLDSDDLFLPHKLRRVAEHLSTLGDTAGEQFLCHDLTLLDTSGATPVVQAVTWFNIVGVDKLPECLTIDQPAQRFPFSIPCGLVFSRGLLADCLAAIPSWDFPRGTDGVLCPSVFLKRGRVDYLHEELGVYRIHGGNELAQLVQGRYLPRFNTNNRVPKLLRHLERWVDSLDQPIPRRAQSLDYLRQLEHMSRRQSASRGLREPLVSIVGLAHPAGGAFDAGHASENLQSAPAVEIIPSAADPGLPELLQMGEAYARASGEYLVFLPAGDRLDRTFVERHLFLRQLGPLVGVSCSDVRLVSAAGSLVSADVFRNSGAWKQAVQQIPPMATRLRDWVAPPRAACLFRRTAFLDHLFARRHEVPAELQAAGFWLVFQVAHHTGGAVRFLETLGSVRLPDGAAASYAYLSAPSGPTAKLVDPPATQAAQWLAAFYQQEQALFRQWLPPAWHQRFPGWLQT